VVVRIFEMYAAGSSYATIAKTFNAEGILSPQNSRRGKPRAWCPTAIREMLRNELYRGARTWNRTETIFNPADGKSKPRPRPESQWVKKEVPELRIVPDDLWHRAREQSFRKGRRSCSLIVSNAHRRSHHPESPMIARRRRPTQGLLLCPR
jgi:hypothetical protein